MSKNKKGGLDQYGAERFVRLIFATIRKNVRLKVFNVWLNTLSVISETISLAQSLDWC